GDGGHIEDASTALLYHPWQEQLGDAQDRFNIESQDQYVVCDRNFPELSPVRRSGVVHQNVDVNTLARQLIKDFLRCFGLRQIFRDGFDEDGSRGFQLCSDRLKLRCDRSDEHQGMFACGEFFRQMQSNTAASSRNQSSFCHQSRFRFLKCKEAALALLWL